MRFRAKKAPGIVAVANIEYPMDPPSVPFMSGIFFLATGPLPAHEQVVW